MANIPTCRDVGAQCHGLDVTLRVAKLDGGPESGDHEATWLLGHTERLDFGPLTGHGAELRCQAYLAIPCRFATVDGPNVACGAHGFSGSAPRPVRQRVERKLAGNQVSLAHHGQLQPIEISPVPDRGLPVRGGDNPCATARCRTADRTVGAACCRDLQIEILCSPEESERESLVRARKSPYLCKVDRESPDSLGAEVISACSFLAADRVSCSLHGRQRPDGRTAKPDLCFDWPSPGDVYHSGCVFQPAQLPK